MDEAPYSLRIKHVFHMRHILILLVPVLILVIAIAQLAFQFKQQKSLQSQAIQNIEPTPEGYKDPDITPATPRFLSNEILLKVKKNAKWKVKEGNPNDTGLAAVNEIAKEKKLKSFEKIAKESKKSIMDGDIFQWYKLSLDEPSEIIPGRFDKRHGSVESDHPGARITEMLLARLGKDTDIETVEPNYVVTTSQTPDASPTPEESPTATAQPSLVPPTDTPSPTVTLEPSPTITATPQENPTPSPTPASSATPTPANVPNDPYYSSSGSWGQSYADLWGIKKINAEGAWGQTTGSPSVIVADIDTGVDRNHPDISANMWVNSAETPDNGTDDDGNGYVDDVNGWDFVNNDGDPSDDHGHGTHTAGTIAAVGNNGIGVVGVNWTAKIMAVKFLNSAGSGTLDNGAKAMQYAADNGAAISSNSWGCGCQSTIVDDGVAYEHDRGMVVVAAAGNSNGDALDFSPASSDRALTIAASDPNDVKASFSNWGEKVDVAAPGVDVLSLKAAVSPMCDASRTVGTNYCRVSGTSMATPHAAGLAALLLARDPTLTNEEIRQLMRRWATDLGTPGKDRDFGYGRIAADATFMHAGDKPPVSLITSPKSRSVIGGSNIQFSGTAAGMNFASYRLEVGSGRSPTSWSNISTVNSPVTNGVLAVANTTQLSDGFYTFRLTVTDTTNIQYSFSIYDVEIDNFDMSISSPADIVSTGPIDVTGTANTKGVLTFDHYTLEWGVGTTPSSWSTQGITLANNGLQPLTASPLGTWDTTNFTSGSKYTLRLSVYATNGSVSYTTETVMVDSDLVKGFPKVVCPVGYDCDDDSYVSTTMADLNGDGVKELIVPALPKLYVFGKDGSNFPGFPIDAPNGEEYHWEANVDDIDQDGKQEIIIATASIAGFTSKLYVYKYDGTLYPGWPKQVTIYQSHFHTDGTPAVADLDGDGVKELLLMEILNNGTLGRLNAFHLDGNQLPSFPKTFPVEKPAVVIPRYGPVSLNDLDHDGIPEIAWGYGEKFYLFDAAGNLLPGWPYTATRYDGNLAVFANAAASGDIDGDGKLEVFAISNVENCGSSCKTLLYAFKKDGTVLAGWPKYDGLLARQFGHNSPTLVDLDNDGDDEVVVGLTNFAVFDAQGKRVIPQLGADQSPVASDFDGDGDIEFVIRTFNTEMKIIHDNTNLYWYRKFDPGTYFGGIPTSADMDNNGKLEVAVVALTNFELPQSKVVYLWEIPSGASGPAQYPWPIYGHDPAKTGRLVRNPIPTPTRLPLPTITPTSTLTPTPSYTPTPTFAPTNTPSPTPSDSIIPTVNITKPKNGARVRPNSIVTIAALASDNVSVSRVEFFVNNALKCTDTAAVYSCIWSVPSTRNVSYTLTAVAYDPSNNSASHSVTVTAR